MFNNSRQKETERKKIEKKIPLEKVEVATM